MTLHSAIMNLNDLSALGQYLREVREGQGLSKEAAAQQLRVRLLYINALESGDWSALPGLAYGRGYLRRYAELLNLPQEEMMAVCDRLQGKVSTRLNYFETVGNEQHPPRSMLWFSSLAMIAVATGWMMWSAPEMPVPNDTPPTLADAVPEVTPSPYPLPAQECMKLVQVVTDPCFMDDRMIRLLDDQKSLLYSFSNHPFIRSSDHP